MDGVTQIFRSLLCYLLKVVRLLHCLHSVCALIAPGSRSSLLLVFVVRRWNLWFPSAGVFAEVLAGRATGTQITFPPPEFTEIK